MEPDLQVFTNLDPYKFCQLVREIAAERPDFTYKSDRGACFYNLREVDGLSSRCIIGEALFRSGVHDTLLQRMVSTFALGEYGQEQWPLNVRMWLSRVQNRQDNGLPWGTCIARADEQADVLQQETP